MLLSPFFVLAGECILPRQLSTVGQLETWPALRRLHQG